MEMMLFLQRPGGDERLIGVTGPVLADSEDEARAALAILDTCPVLDRAIAASPYMPAELADLLAASAMLFPTGNRFAVDNMWTRAPAAELLPGLRRIADDPAARAVALHVDELGAVAGAARHGLLARGRRLHRPLRVVGRCGGRRALRRLARRADARDGAPRERDPARGREPRAAAGAASLRATTCAGSTRSAATYDPDGRFHSWMGRPSEAPTPALPPARRRATSLLAASPAG